MTADRASCNRIPVSTYRLQFRPGFGFAEALPLVGYLHALGVGDIYASPLLEARPGSIHGYDVVDHRRLNPELGGGAAFERFAGELRRLATGLLVDVVPNHMCITGPVPGWWKDILENGPSSPFARYFDIDWDPPKAELNARVLLPILPDQYGRVLEDQGIEVQYRKGAFSLRASGSSLPVNPRTWVRILEPVLQDLRARWGDADERVLEMESICTALRNLPLRTETDPPRVRERQREKEIVRRRLAALTGRNPAAREAIQRALRDLNGRRGDPRSFDRLERLLADQAYRLSHWRVASDEINYRRFFDVNELAALRVEEPEVFRALHAVPLRLMQDGLATGFRIDHVDGLRDPLGYLGRLQEAARTIPRGAGAPADAPCYVVVEKILGPGEALPARWPIDGTTGYDFLNLLNGLFVEEHAGAAFGGLYARFTGENRRFADVAYECRKLILHASMSGELTMLTARLDGISEQHRYSRDFTRSSQQAALAEVIACFPVYRTYVRPEDETTPEPDRRNIEAAIAAAKHRNPVTDPSIFDFIRSVLLLDHPEGLDAEAHAVRKDFVLRFQQLTGPVMAKGLEDTAFYRYLPLASLVEVGGDPDRFGVDVEEFHREGRDRAAARPHTLLATSTHDTKRGEDMRARLNVLSEMPGDWEDAILRWKEWNARGKDVRDGVPAPDPGEEYLLYQTLVGTWEGRPAGQEYAGRIEAYMTKVLREAKVHTSWIHPNEAYEEGVRGFVARLLDPGKSGDFLADLDGFVARVAGPGLWNSLSATLLKITSPGVPDFYQGTELLDFRLVDPDNRGLVDFGLRMRILEEVLEGCASDPRGLAVRLLGRPESGEIKLFVTHRGLLFRSAHPQLFQDGRYLPLRPEGERARHLVAFARATEREAAIAVASRFSSRLPGAPAPPVGRDAWGETILPLGDLAGHGRFRDALTGAIVHPRDGDRGPVLLAREVLADLPVGLLEALP